ncbi:Eukaryotic translation initiation factor 4G [Sesamum angolense]|uniref:Eukaryotic translation initiation factor 4G n=1 Tax=Sesamum angolense TaxID=2727404 RepID=A0AAE2C6X6_9LAMI|nr:Eukaryotic translation initiation factor 4G [Sesamum angolense]
MAYKGPAENKEAVTSADGSEKSSIISEKQTSANVSQDNAAPCEKPAQGKVEPDDWEDAAEISSPQLETSKNENDDKDGDGYELATKRYKMVSSAHVSRQSYPSPGRTIDRPLVVLDQIVVVVASEMKINGVNFLVSYVGRGDMRTDVGYASNIVGFRPGQGGNYGVLRNPRAQTPMQYAGGILSGPMQSLGPHGGIQRNNSDSDRWQRGAGFQKDLPDLSVENERITFKILLLNKCQEEFEREKEKKRRQIKLRKKVKLNRQRKRERRKTPSTKTHYQNPDEENIEALCKLMSTIGEMIDHPKAKNILMPILISWPVVQQYEAFVQGQIHVKDLSI